MTPAAQPPKKRVPLGKPIQHSDQELDELSQITPADIEAAKVFWRKHAPAKTKKLLDAVPADDASAASNS